MKSKSKSSADMRGIIASKTKQPSANARGRGFSIGEPLINALNPAAFGQNGNPHPVYVGSLGALFSGDCLEVLPHIATSSVDTVFADPPFNIGKDYGDSVNDQLTEGNYLRWCHSWIEQCVRALKPGGAFFLYNLPKWNIRLASFLLANGMNFRHWIVVDIKLGLPIPGRLYPSHYSLLYFTKGKHKTFRNIRTPIRSCRHCGGDVKDYGGHRGCLNPKGVNLSDVWTDIPPVRHWKFKSRKRKANSLSTKLLDRIVEMSTEQSDIVLDPFGGSGTTFAVCQKKGRHWIGIEIESTDVIIERLENDDLRDYKNEDFVELAKPRPSARRSVTLAGASNPGDGHEASSKMKTIEEGLPMH